MKRIILLLVIGVLLAACSATTAPETAVPIPEEPAKPATAVPEEESPEEKPTVETGSEPDVETEDAPAETAVVPGFPATNVQEASIVRDRDWTQGTDDPLVTIIEYGDFQ